MTICFPVIRRNDQLLGSSFLAKRSQTKAFFICTLHQLGVSSDPIGLLIPRHEGNVTKVQGYEYSNLPIAAATVEYADPISDFAVLSIPIPLNSSLQSPVISEASDNISVGLEVAVVGYPLSVIGSIVQTYDIANVSAMIQRPYGIDEMVINRPTYSGSSGSVVVERSGNSIIGMVRGCIAPPAMMSVGSLPVGTDTNMTVGLYSSCFFSVVQRLAKDDDHVR